MSFPLFFRLGGVCVVDDDADYLDMLGLVLPANWHVHLINRPHACIGLLRDEAPEWEQDFCLQQEIVARWHNGQALIPQIMAYWAEHPHRHQISRVCVVDYSMPGLNGLQMLTELGDWPGAAMLLTGQADEQVGIQAFNRRLIGQFVAKQEPDISRHIIRAIRSLMFQASDPAPVWRLTCSSQQVALVRQPAIQEAMARLIESRGWVEHILLGQPFGLLGLTAAGQVEWLQIEVPEGLEDLAELAMDAGVARTSGQAIRSGRVLPALELGLLEGMPPTPPVAPAEAWEAPNRLLVALHFLPPSAGPGIASYEQFLGKMPARQVWA